MTYIAVAVAIPTPLLAAAGGERRPARGAFADWPRCGRCHVGGSGALCAAATGCDCGCPLRADRVSLLPFARGWR